LPHQHHTLRALVAIAGSFMIAKDLIPEMGAKSFAIMVGS
jgi:hypothetical protein